MWNIFIGYNTLQFLSWLINLFTIWNFQINLGMYLDDGKSELSVLVDRAVGGSSIQDGELEIMLHRFPLFCTINFVVVFFLQISSYYPFNWGMMQAHSLWWWSRCGRSTWWDYLCTRHLSGSYCMLYLPLLWFLSAFILPRYSILLIIQIWINYFIIEQFTL